MIIILTNISTELANFTEIPDLNSQDQLGHVCEVLFLAAGRLEHLEHDVVRY